MKEETDISPSEYYDERFQLEKDRDELMDRLKYTNDRLAELERLMR